MFRHDLIGRWVMSDNKGLMLVDTQVCANVGRCEGFVSHMDKFCGGSWSWSVEMLGLDRILFAWNNSALKHNLNVDILSSKL